MFLGRKGVFTKKVFVLFERLFVEAGLLALALAAYHGHATVLDDLVDGLHRARCGLAPAADVSRHATGTCENPRTPLLSINDMYRVEAPNVEWAVKPEVRDPKIIEMVPEVVDIFQLLKRALPDLKIKAGIDMLLGEAFENDQPGRADDNRCSTVPPLSLLRRALKCSNPIWRRRVQARIVSLLLLSWHVLQEVHRSEETRTLQHEGKEDREIPGVRQSW